MQDKKRDRSHDGLHKSYTDCTECSQCQLLAATDTDPSHCSLLQSHSLMIQKCAIPLLQNQQTCYNQWMTACKSQRWGVAYWGRAPRCPLKCRPSPSAWPLLLCCGGYDALGGSGRKHYSYVASHSACGMHGENMASHEETDVQCMISAKCTSSILPTHRIYIDIQCTYIRTHVHTHSLHLRMYVCSHC